jgi:hypothetical protein
VILASVAAAIALASVVVAAVGAPSAAPAVACPRDTAVSVQTPATVERAVLRLVPNEYRRLRSMGRPAWPHAQVVGVVSLVRRLYAPQPPLRALAVRLCGAKVADASWVVFLQFPWCQLPCSEDTAFAAHTRTGWRIWYSEFRRP